MVEMSREKAATSQHEMFLLFVNAFRVRASNMGRRWLGGLFNGT
jgi:hypothetical protein